MPSPRSLGTSLRVGLVAALLFGSIAWPAAQQRRLMTDTDLFAFVWVADPQMSPDGTQVAFVRVDVSPNKGGYDTSLWLAHADGSAPPRRLSAGTRDTAPRWSPDGRRLAFVRAAEKDGKTQPPQIFVLSMEGGEAKPVTDLPKGASNPVWAPDSTRLAFSSTTLPSDSAAPPDSKPDAKAHESDVTVVTEAEYRSNGIGNGGYVELDRPSHLWTVSLPDERGSLATPQPLTAGAFTESNARWSPDGARLFFVSDRVVESYYQPSDSDLYAVPASGGDPIKVASIDGTIGAHAVSHDGKRLAFLGTLHGTPVRSYSQPDLWVMDLPSGAPRNLTAAYDFDIEGGLGGDQRAPRGQMPGGPIWSRDDRSILIRVGEQGVANLKRIDIERATVTPVTDGDQDIMGYSADRHGERLAFVRSTQTVLGDLYVANAAGAAAGAGTRNVASTRLTTFNDELFGALTLSEPEELRYTSFDGTPIQGWILKPPAFDPSRKYPLILEIHGGPHSAYGHTFTHEFQWMAAKGYVVLFTNPRGSSNYGQEFGNVIQYRYPGDDHKDLMAGVDALLKKGYIDEQRMGVTGGSGGGLLTNWVVTQTTRFKAAVSQRDISDWASFWYTADFWLYQPTWFRKAPFEDPAEFAQRSPLTYAAKIVTPMLFILGDWDYRTPPAAGGEALFRALKYQKKPAVMVRFPRESHELSRSGEPWHRVERLQHIVGWMDRWLLGKGAATMP